MIHFNAKFNIQKSIYTIYCMHVAFIIADLVMNINNEPVLFILRSIVICQFNVTKK